MSSTSTSEFALQTANGSYDWYRVHAIRARRAFKALETSLLLVSASVPLLILAIPKETEVNAVTSAIVVVLVGFRSIFHWHENYLRFSRAREAVELERRLHTMGRGPYADPSSRDGVLVERVSEIEREEMGSWLQIAAHVPTK